jgi:VWFA-related protein
MNRKLAVLLFVVALPLSAQVRETIEVAITSIDVVVTDAKGNRIRGLTRADFEILEDGKPREITNFSEYSSTAPPVTNAVTTVHGAVVTPAASTPPPRRLLIVFDSNTLTSVQRRSGAAAVVKFVEQHMRPNDRVMVAVMTQMFTPRTEWITDHAELKRAIEKVGSEVTAIGSDALRKDTEDEMRYLSDIAASTAGADPSIAPPSFEELMTIGRRYAEQVLIETRNTASVLGKVLSQLAIYPEKKALIFVGEGLEARPGWEIFEKLESIRSQKVPSVGAQVMLGMGSTAGVSPLTEANRFSAVAVLQNLADTAYQKGVPIYAINPGVNEDGANEHNELPDVNQQFARFTSKAEGYKMVGEGSGGAAYIGMRAELALDNVAGDLGGYYSLGFRASGKPTRAAIRVKTKTPQHRVRTALAVAPSSPADAIMEAVVAHHVLDPENNDLEIELDAQEPVAFGEKQKVTLKVIIPIRNLSLQRQGDEVTGGFDVYLSISDGKGYFSDVNKQSHAIKWSAAEVGEDDERTMTYSIDVTLERGASQISVGVVDQRSKKTGYEKIVM